MTNSVDLTTPTIELWYGLGPHEMDIYFHWQDTKTDVEHIRSLFDMIPTEHRESVKKLMELAKDFGALEEYETNHPDL